MRIWLLSEIAEEMARAGLTKRAREISEQALRVAEEIEEIQEQARALVVIVEGMAKVGMFEQALKIAEEVREAGWQVEALKAIYQTRALKATVEEMAKSGMFEQALKIAEGIEEAWRRAEALREIAGEMAKAGMVERAKEVFDQALKTAEEIKEIKTQVEALMAITGKMVKARMFDQALEVAEGIGRAWVKAWVLSAIAEEMARAGLVKRAEEIFGQALKVATKEMSNLEVKALSGVAKGMAKAGMFDQALKLAEGIKWAWKRAWILGAVAEGMARAGGKERAREVFNQALEAAKEIGGTLERELRLWEIAKAMAQVREIEGVVSIVKREAWMRTKLLSSVLPILANQASEGDEESKEGFLRLLPLCGWSLKFAYQACGLLAWLYPERGEEIAGVVRGE